MRDLCYRLAVAARGHHHRSHGLPDRGPSPLCRADHRAPATMSLSKVASHRRNDAVLSGLRAGFRPSPNATLKTGAPDSTPPSSGSGRTGAWAGIAACGSCVLSQYGGICPITRCAKRLLNGPCGGSRKDRCEVRADRQCAWQLIYERLRGIGQVDRLKEIAPPKNWSSNLDGGYRMILREDHRI
jgi:hypothetical protein